MSKSKSSTLAFESSALAWFLLAFVAMAGSPAAVATEASGVATAPPKKQCDPSPPPYRPSAEQEERDEIFALLAYAVVYKDWQTSSSVGRGYNIGGVLVDPDDVIVCWARNSVNKTRNGTQHGEVRLITNYLSNVENKSLKGYKLYTTLEPCAMCSGMMTLTSTYLTIFGQHDPGFGDAIQRLELNSTSIDGYCPYPRGVISSPSTTGIRKQIDDAYEKTLPNSITKWLAGPAAEGLFKAARDELATYKTTYPGNAPILKGAREFLKGVPSAYTATPYCTGCPRCPPGG